MFQRDYLMRMIEQMTEALGAALGLRQQKKFEEAYGALDDLLHRLSLPKRGVLKALAVPDLIALLSGRGVPETDKLYAAAKVLWEDGETAADAGEAHASDASRRKAIRLYAEAVRIARAQGAPPPDAAELDAMLSGAGRTAFSADDFAALAYAYESYGRFDAAENFWFEALALDAADAGLFEQGERFYERLLRTDEAALAAGGLPSEEVREGLREFRRSFGSRPSE